MGYSKEPPGPLSSEEIAEIWAGWLLTKMETNLSMYGLQLVTCTFRSPTETTEPGSAEWTMPGVQYVSRAMVLAAGFLRANALGSSGAKFLVVTEAGARFGRLHLHVLYSGPGWSLEAMARWWNRAYGRVHIRVCDNDAAAARYCCKYLVKGQYGTNSPLPLLLEVD